MNNIIIASEHGIYIDSPSDISDAISKTLDADGLILTEKELSPQFFNLGSGLAGELFQKLTNYEIRLAVVIANHQAYGQRFSELAYEHRKHHHIRFVYSVKEAKGWLAK